MLEGKEKFIPPDRRRGKVGNLYFEGLVPPEIKHNETILFVHGSGMNYKSGLPIVEFFAQPENGYRALTFSLRGHRGSEISQEEYSQTNFNDYIADTAQMSSFISEEFGTESKNQIIIGHSMGGLLAMKHAEKYGAKDLILLSSGLPKQLIERFGLQNVYPDVTPQAIETMKSQIANGNIYSKPASRLLAYFKETPIDFETDFKNKYEPLVSPEAPTARFEVHVTPPDIDQEKIKCPTLVINGTHDVMDPKYFKALADQLGADYNQYTGGHALMFEQNWLEIAQDINSWLEKH